ncbi:MAG TPA: Plug domain-containing protein, partial [Gemmatimonadaceae bacterium]|nr:Plug domain-containing protein [Gemmatimonadaceae bacterium]
MRRDTAAVVPIPPQRDTSVFADSLADTTRARRHTARAEPRDTIKAPLARAERPPVADIAREYRWDRAALFANGHVTLADLLEEIPGVTGLRSGWLNSPMIGAYLGDIARVRLFYDGVELPPLDPSFGGASDLGRVPVWSLEDVTVERGADELRVHMRTWRTQRTTSNTRTDVMTGDEDTNLYRGFFAKRFRRGEALQVGAQQYGTTAPRSGDGGGDALSLLARVG